MNNSTHCEDRLLPIYVHNICIIIVINSLLTHAGGRVTFARVGERTKHHSSYLSVAPYLGRVIIVPGYHFSPLLEGDN